jgi:hypothetical protein
MPPLKRQPRIRLRCPDGLDSAEDALRSQWQITEFDAQPPESVVDRRHDRRRRPDGTALSDAFSAE